MTPRERWSALYRQVRLLDRDFAPRSAPRDAHHRRAARGKMIDRATRLFRDEPLPLDAPERSTFTAPTRGEMLGAFRRSHKELGNPLNTQTENQREYLYWAAFGRVASFRALRPDAWPTYSDFSNCYMYLGNSGYRLWVLADREAREGREGPATALLRAFARKMSAPERGPLCRADIPLSAWLSIGESLMEPNTGA